MTEGQKASRYDTILAEADRIQRLKSKLQSANAGINTTSDEYDKTLAGYNKSLELLEIEMRKLFSE